MKSKVKFTLKTKKENTKLEIKIALNKNLIKVFTLLIIKLKEERSIIDLFKIFTKSPLLVSITNMHKSIQEKLIS
ncbi:hypothetical protein [uncultured Clostridium sp.]|uniref:hypothetical protein n=1 Tax=uncultured Clostridium sp. TaxID=59620 RepID=UPI00262953D7|nr:hypothetical protein [uncultured Clostridium sp.]